MTDFETNCIGPEQGKKSDSNGWHETERRKLAPLGIGFDGRYYRYKAYRYDLLSDALNYARVDRARSAHPAEEGIPPKWIAPEMPTAEQQQRMAKLGVSFDGKYYRYGGYRYEKFSDAINYALLKR